MFIVKSFEKKRFSASVLRTFLISIISVVSSNDDDLELI